MLPFYKNTVSQAFPHSNNSWESSVSLATEWPLKHSAPFPGALEPFLNLPTLILPWHRALLTAHSGHPRDHPSHPSPKFLSLGTLCPQTLCHVGSSLLFFFSQSKVRPLDPRPQSSGSWGKGGEPGAPGSGQPLPPTHSGSRGMGMAPCGPDISVQRSKSGF